MYVLKSCSQVFYDEKPRLFTGYSSSPISYVNKKAINKEIADDKF